MRRVAADREAVEHDADTLGPVTLHLHHRLVNLPQDLLKGSWHRLLHNYQPERFQ